LGGGLNTHAYVPNPVAWVDPLGLQAGPATCKIPKSGRFATADGAAKAALVNANPKSIRDNLEYGGLIYKTPNGRYDFTKPTRGTDQGVNPWSAQGAVPKCAQVVGDYHTHGDYSLAGQGGKAIRTSNPKQDSFNSDNFSGGDYTGISSDARGKPEYKGYLGTPSGVFKVFDPKTRTTGNL
jgi:uncharacterized protein RhaS with RHS repeats